MLWWCRRRRRRRAHCCNPGLSHACAGAGELADDGPSNAGGFALVAAVAQRRPRGRRHHHQPQQQRRRRRRCLGRHLRRSDASLFSSLLSPRGLTHLLLAGTRAEREREMTTLTRSEEEKDDALWHPSPLLYIHADSMHAATN